MDELKAQLKAEQKLLEKQQAQIQALESALATQQRVLATVAHEGVNSPAVVPAVDRSVEVNPDGFQPSGEQPTQPEQQPPTTETASGGKVLQRGQEISGVTPTSPKLQLGPADIHFLGYPALTMVYRSTNSGVANGTSFITIPYSDTVLGDTSEFRNGLSVPNTTPDFVVKASFDGKPGGHAAHLDVGGLLRVFRNYAPYTGNGVSNHNYAAGGNANFSFEIAKGVRLVLDGFLTSGGGRYIGGLMPDVIVRANGDISPIKSYSWLGGFEFAPSKATGIYAYYSGAYGSRNTAIDTDGSYIGWGYPGASNAADRVIDKVTGGYSRVLWSREGLRSAQFSIQYGYLSLQPWVQGTGPTQANEHMILTQMRYNLP